VSADNRPQEKYLLGQGRNNAACGQCCHTKARVCPDLRVVRESRQLPAIRKLTAEFGGDVCSLTLDRFECCISRFGNLGHANAQSHTSTGLRRHAILSATVGIRSSNLHKISYLQRRHALQCRIPTGIHIPACEGRKSPSWNDIRTNGHSFSQPASGTRTRARAKRSQCSISLFLNNLETRNTEHNAPFGSANGSEIATKTSSFAGTLVAVAR
jgi:hypothetical protein